MTNGTTTGLATELRGWPDDRLAALLVARPDLASPPPNGLHAMAARATSHASVSAALADLTREDLQAAAAVLTGAPASARLLDRALAWPERGSHVLVDGLARVVDGRALGPKEPEPPSVATTPTRDDAAGLAAAEAIMLTDEALWRIGQAPPRVLRTGGIPALDVRALGRTLGIDVHTTALLLHLARGARLLAATDDDEPAWLPTDEYDEWRALPAVERWAVLATTWLRLRDAPHLVGTRGERGTVNALAPEAVWAPVRTLRRHVLEELATVDGGPSPADLTARVRWRHALVTVPDHADVVAAVLREATWLGIAAPGLATAGRTMLAGGEDAPPMPDRVDRVLLGADLTAVAPGLLDGDTADLLWSVGDVESRGAATVVRLTAASLDRALDAGWTAPLLRERLTALSGSLPQPLEFLLDDAARRHGALVVGAASSYLTCDDPAVLADIAGNARLGLRVVAPTVAVSSLAPTVLLNRLRGIGRVPAVAGPEGEVQVVGAVPARSTAPRERPAPRALDLATAHELVAAIKAGGSEPATDASDPETVRSLLADAAATGTTVRVDYVGPGGTPVVVDLTPSVVEPGRVRGILTGTTDGERVISLARISRVRA